MAILELKISKEEFVTQLRKQVELKREFASHFDSTITKPFYGKVMDEQIDIKNTPRLSNVPTLRISGSITDKEFRYKTSAPYWWLILTFTISSICLSAVVIYFNQVELGLGFIGMALFANIVTLIPFAINRNQFNRLVNEINSGSRASP